MNALVKYFRFSHEEILWKISYANISMYLATIPRYEADEEGKKKEKDEEPIQQAHTIDDVAKFLNIQKS